MKKLFCLTMIISLFLIAAPVRADELPEKGLFLKKDFYNHPIRIAAYIGYPVGLLIDSFIFKPIFYIIQVEPVDKLFGIEPEEKF